MGYTMVAATKPGSMILTIPKIELQTTVDKYSGSKMEIYKFIYSIA